MGKHPKENRPNITWPSPDPAKESITTDFKPGDQVKVKDHIFHEGLDLSGKIGVIKKTDSYLEVRISMDMPSINEDGVKILAYNTATFKLLRYEVEPHTPVVLDRTW